MFPFGPRTGRGCRCRRTALLTMSTPPALLCPGGCGISVRKIDNRVVKIEGAADHPINNGGVCMLGLSAAQLLYSPTRIPTPLKRVGGRGQGQWQTISWSDAVFEVASKLTDIRTEGKPQSVACLAAKDTGTVFALIQRFLGAYGSPNFIRMPSVDDAYQAVLRLTQGARGYAGVDAENADFILSFGCAILDGYGSPVRMFQANSTWKEKHATLVQIEPRLSNTAAKSDHWVPITPGTEADLALALAQVIIANGRYHHDFINMHTEGFDAFTKMLNEKYTPEAVAGPCRSGCSRHHRSGHALCESPQAAGASRKGERPEPRQPEGSPGGTQPQCPDGRHQTGRPGFSVFLPMITSNGHPYRKTASPPPGCRVRALTVPAALTTRMSITWRHA